MTFRNNILHVKSDSSESIGDRTTSLANDLDYDLLSRDIRASGAQGVRGIKRKPSSDPGNDPGRFCQPPRQPRLRRRCSDSQLQ
jgi:hypothetical protein